MTKRLSIASDIFAILCEEYPVNSSFTSGDLKVLCNTRGINASEGAVQGFLNRALKKKVLTYDSTYRTPKNQLGYFYRVLKHEGWNFHAPSLGSEPGRKITSNRPTFNGEPITVIETPKSEPKAKVQFGSDKTVSDWAEKCVTDGTATDEIMIRLAEVMALIEAQRNQKTKISEFSDDEIADEVKRRFHSK